MRSLSFILLFSLLSSPLYAMDENQKKVLVFGCIGGVCAYTGSRLLDGAINRINRWRTPNIIEQKPRQDEFVINERVASQSDLNARIKKLEEDTIPALMNSMNLLVDVHEEGLRELYERDKKSEKNITDLFKMLNELTKSRKTQAVLLGEHHQAIIFHGKKINSQQNGFDRLLTIVSKLCDAINEHQNKEADTMFNPDEIQKIKEVMQKYDSIDRTTDDDSSERTRSIFLSESKRRLSPLLGKHKRSISDSGQPEKIADIAGNLTRSSSLTIFTKRSDSDGYDSAHSDDFPYDS